MRQIIKIARIRLLTYSVFACKKHQRSLSIRAASTRFAAFSVSEVARRPLTGFRFTVFLLCMPETRGSRENPLRVQLPSYAPVPRTSGVDG